MNYKLPLIIDEKDKEELQNILKELETKKISLHRYSDLPALKESGRVYCIITNNLDKWPIEHQENLLTNEWLLAGFKGNSNLFARKVAINNLLTITDNSLRLYGQILWHLFAYEFAAYSKGNVSALFNLLRLGMLIVSPDGYILHANDEMEILTGWSIDKLELEHLSHYIRFRNDLREQGIVMQKLTMEPRMLGSFEFLFRDGKWHSLYYYSFKFLEPTTGDEIIIVITGFQSGCELEEVNNLIDRMQERAILHDFRNLLQGVVTYTDLLSFELSEGSTAWGYIEKMRNELRRGQETLRQLMYPEPLTDSDLTLDQMIESLITTLRELTPSNITLSFSGACPKSVAISSIDLGRVVRNLVKNAVEAINQSSGEIAIHTNLLVGSGKFDESGDYAQLTITDNGPGIPEPLQDKIFEAFYTTRRDRGGLGLGLYSVYTIVKQNGGTIYFKSEPQKGTTFVIHLPLTQKNV